METSYLSLGDKNGKDTHISFYLYLVKGGKGNKYSYSSKFELVCFKGKYDFDRGINNWRFGTKREWMGGAINFIN